MVSGVTWTWVEMEDMVGCGVAGVDKRGVGNEMVDVISEERGCCCCWWRVWYSLVAGSCFGESCKWSRCNGDVMQCKFCTYRIASPLEVRNVHTCSGILGIEWLFGHGWKRCMDTNLSCNRMGIVVDALWGATVVRLRSFNQRWPGMGGGARNDEAVFGGRKWEEKEKFGGSNEGGPR